MAVASARGFLDLDRWAANNLARIPDLPHSLLTFLNIKAEHELVYQRQKNLCSVMLPVKTIAKLLQALEDAIWQLQNTEERTSAEQNQWREQEQTFQKYKQQAQNNGMTLFVVFCFVCCLLLLCFVC